MSIQHYYRPSNKDKIIIKVDLCFVVSESLCDALSYGKLRINIKMSHINVFIQEI
jgi:hypothetical protein